MASRSIEVIDAQTEFTAFFEGEIQKLQIANLHKPNKRILDMPGHLFSKLINHEVEQRAGGGPGAIEKFYDDNVLKSTRNHVFGALMESYNDGSLNLEDM